MAAARLSTASSSSSSSSSTNAAAQYLRASSGGSNNGNGAALADLAGWATKQGSFVKSWKRRFFELRGIVVIYFTECSSSGVGIEERGRLRASRVTQTAPTELTITGMQVNQRLRMRFDHAEDCRAWQQQLETALVSAANHKSVPNTYCDHSGWATKLGATGHSWKRRFFVLKGTQLIYFEDESPSGKGINEKGHLAVSHVSFTTTYARALDIFGTLKNQRVTVQFERNEDCLEWQKMIEKALRTAGKATQDARLAAQRRGDAVKEGFLWKEGQNFKNWKKRHMRLVGRVIQYRASPDEQPLGEVTIYTVNRNKRKFSLDIYSDNNRIFRIAADSFDEIKDWDLALASAIGRPPCFGDQSMDLMGQQHDAFHDKMRAPDLDCDGWLYLRVGRTWTKQYFTLKGHSLQYAASKFASVSGDGTVIDLRLGMKPEHLEINVNGNWLTLAADMEDEVTKWVEALCELLDKLPMMLDRVDITTRSLERAGSSMSAASYDTDSSQGAALRKTGWLRKEGQSWKSWKRRFFLLEGKRLQYFEDVGMSSIKGDGVVARVETSVKHANGLDIYFTSGRVLRVTAENVDEMESWREALGCDGRRESIASSIRGSSFSSQCTLRSSTGSEGAMASGWMVKLGKNFRNWKERYFVLDGRLLSYSAGIGEEPLGRGIITSVRIGMTRPFSFEVRLQSGRIHTLATRTQDQMVMWCGYFKAAVTSRDDDTPSEDLVGAFDDDDEGEDSSVANVPGGRPPLHQAPSSDDIAVEEVEDMQNLRVNEGDPRLCITQDFDTHMVVCSGFLQKEGGTFKSWKVRFFTLYGSLLSYFKTEQGPLLSSETVVHVKLSHSHKHNLAFDITLQNGRHLIAQAESESDARRWFAALSRAIAAPQQPQKRRPEQLQHQQSKSDSAIVFDSNGDEAVNPSRRPSFENESFIMMPLPDATLVLDDDDDDDDDDAVFEV
ncbi:hypothetical protein P43SY_000248 [Pythium insidiosum]|uniref:PH domain-containing protein n=1 Tax=Pythium insidiosum TaxID=114742 RepID=A0AAD5M5P5_PYTIN|nr:hypothetical protein P43SY_000248 [Pythium insidiosum]